MAKASVTLPDGTSVAIDGSPEEVAKILALYGGAISKAGGPSSSTPTRPKQKTNATKKEASPLKESSTRSSVDLAAIIETIKNCDEADNIETEILDKTSQVNRILLPMFIVHEYMNNGFTMTSGELSQVLKDLGTPIHRSNISNILSKTASRYVIGDKVRKQGQAVHYKLSRPGVQYLKKVLKRDSGDK